MKKTNDFIENLEAPAKDILWRRVMDELNYRFHELDTQPSKKAANRIIDLCKFKSLLEKKTILVRCPILNAYLGLNVWDTLIITENGFTKEEKE